MIRSGRISAQASSSVLLSDRSRYRTARLTTILGSLIFTAFLCTSVSAPKDPVTPPIGAVQVISPVDGTVSDGDTHTSVQEDGSIWAYFESLLRHLLLDE